MEKKPKTHEELFEMYDQVNRQEEKGKEMIATMDSMMLKLKEFQKVLKSIPASVSKGSVLRKKKIYRIDIVIHMYKKTKTYGEYLMKQQKPDCQQVELNKLLELRSHPEQWSSTPTKDLSTIQMVLEGLLKMHSITLTLIEGELKTVEENMDMIDVSIMESAKHRSVS